ncbi:unnamed protein product [Rangifer tarandus platyrhynchus]|uniref:Uncharacterized protein n=1 Tax=Rangifer tarandus platyrhynchus TaxID=3082113 RepID=A0AC59YG66_RANTA
MSASAPARSRAPRRLIGVCTHSTTLLTDSLGWRQCYWPRTAVVFNGGKPGHEDLKASLQAPPSFHPSVRPWELVCSPPPALGWDTRWAPHKLQGDCQVPVGRAAQKARVRGLPPQSQGTVPLKRESTDSTPQPSPAILPAPVSAHWGERTRAHATGGVSANAAAGCEQLKKRDCPRGLGLGSPSGRATRGEPPGHDSARGSEEQTGPLTLAAALLPGGALSAGLGFPGSVEKQPRAVPAALRSMIVVA